MYEAGFSDLVEDLKISKKVKPDLQEVRPIEGVYIYKTYYTIFFVFTTIRLLRFRIFCPPGEWAKGLALTGRGFSLLSLRF